MKSRTRVVSALLVALMLVMPLATIASAQQPPPPPAPEMFQDSLKAQQAAEADRKMYDAGAVATNVFRNKPVAVISYPDCTNTCSHESALHFSLVHMF